MTNYAINQKSLFDILDGESVYCIPDYQRAYEWKKVQVEELWDDLMHVYMENPSNSADEYLLGPIVVETKSKENSYTVVDGQQRLITLTLLFCTIRESIQEYLTVEESETDKVQKKNLIENINEITNHDGKGIITLNDEKSNLIFQSIQLGNTNIKELNEKLKHKHGLNNELNDASKKLIINYKFLLSEVQALCGNCKLESNGAELVKAIYMLNKIILNLRKKNLFVHVNIFNDSYSHQVFQSLNSKGQSLTQAALIKSYLLRISPALSHK